MRTLKAKLVTIAPNFFPMAEIDDNKVRALVAYLTSGGKIPPVVVAMYGDKVMPLDGHHRLSACRILGRNIEAWLVSGKSFDRLCIDHRNAEEFVTCDGIKAMDVARHWNDGHHQQNAS